MSSHRSALDVPKNDHSFLPFPMRSTVLTMPCAFRRSFFCVVIVLTGCASVAPSATDEFNDPWEPFNRQVFEFNLRLDRALIKPAAKGYRALLPQFVRDRIRSIIDNLNEP